MLDHPVLAGGVAALKEDEDAVAARDQAALKLDQLDLQLVQVTAIVVLDRIAARGRIGRWAWRPVWHLPQRSVAMYSIRSSISARIRPSQQGPQLIGGQGHEALSGQLGWPYLQYGIDFFSRKHAGQKTSPQPEQWMPVLSGSNLCPHSGQHHSPDCFVNGFVKGTLSNIISSTSRTPSVDYQGRKSRAVDSPRGSPVGEHRNFGVREYLDGLAAEDDRGDAVATVRGHDDQVTAFRCRRIDNRSVGMLVLELNLLACYACCLRQVGDLAENFLSTLLHACLVLSRRILDHRRVGREHMKGRQDRQDSSFGANPHGQGDAVADSHSSKFRSVRCYQDVGVHRTLLGFGCPLGAQGEIALAI